MYRQSFLLLLSLSTIACTRPRESPKLPESAPPTTNSAVAVSTATAAMVPATQPIAPAAAVLPASKSLLTGELAAFGRTGNFKTNATAEPVDVVGHEGAPTRALRVTVRERQPNDYAIQLRQPVEAALRKGDVVWLSVWIRTIQTFDESGQGWMGVVLEKSAPPNEKVIARRAGVGKEWEQVCVPAKLKSDAAEKSLSVSLRMGSAAQTIELADLQLLSFDNPEKIDIAALPQTRITYPGREADAAWRKEANARIDEIRKAPLTVRVVNAEGQPVAAAQVAVELKKHAFPFGCVYNLTNIIGDRSTTPDSLIYQKKYVEMFNVSVDEWGMKWPALVSEKNQATALAAIDWMHSRGIAVRGHCLIWPSWRHTPEFLKALAKDPAAMRQKIAEHISKATRAFAGKVSEWDVINEPYVNHDVMDVLGYKEMAEWFKLARAGDPSARLYLNETSVPTSPPGDNHYDVLLEHARIIQNNGGDLGGIGMQAHFGSSLTAPIDLKKIYDRFATLNVPLQITELDIDVPDDQVQADYLRDFMTMSFSHPNVNGIMMWGFWAGQHWRPDAALFTKDWKIRPVGQAWMDLVQKEWKTVAAGETGSDGSLSVRGFLGEYAVTVTVDGKKSTIAATLTKSGEVVTVTLP